MSPQPQKAAGKRPGQTLGDVNNVSGQTKDSFLLHVTDLKLNQKWLVDGGALLSIIPPTPQHRLQGPNGTQLRAANGTDIKCYGTVNRTISIGNRNFNFDFIIADVRNRILGADFLAHFGLAPNHRDAQLIDLQDFSILPASHARGFSNCPVNFVSQQDDPFFKLLDQFPEIQTPTFTIKDPKHGVRHHIPTPDAPPIQSRARRLDPEKLAVAKAELEKLVDLGIAYRGKSEWSSPLLVTTKPCGGWRVCGDYRRLNALTEIDQYPVRTLQDFTAELQGKKYFSKIDLMKGYHQIPVADDDIRKTAVITPFGLFIFPRTPFGLKNAGQDFQRLMDEILGDVPRVFVYIDDILVASETLEQHLADLEIVFKALSENGLVIQRSKCQLGKSSLDFLGYFVDHQGITPLQDKVTAIRATKPPTTVKELQRFLGMVGYYRKFIPGAATHLYHMFEALKGKPKTLTWTPECQKSFDETKAALANASMLYHPRIGGKLALTTDASNTAIGGVLEQRGPKGWEPLAFYSSKLEPHQQSWPPYDRELLGAFKSVRHFKHMVEGRPFTLYTDHQSLVPSMKKKTDPQTIRQTYQLACISEFTTDIQYLQGKANVVADALSRPNEDLAINAISDENSTFSTNPSTQLPRLMPNRLDNSTSETSTSLQPSMGTCETLESADPTGLSPTAASNASSSTTEASATLSSTSAATTRSTEAETRRQTATEDLGCVINAIGDLGIDWREIASQQPLDPDFRRLRQEARTGLNFKTIDIGGTPLIVDISNGPARPFIPLNFRKAIFDSIHGLGHPGVERTRQSVRSKVVWPSLNEDVSRWARDCNACQLAKVTRHTVPPIGDFTVPQKRFDHLHLDIVTLPISNGYRYLLTIVDRFTRWPTALPMVDISTQSVVDSFVHGWIANYGVPSTITTDRGSQFSSAIFTQLTRTWGINAIMTTPYHPEANGMVERFHRRLKESLIALGNDEPDKWFWKLPMALLAIRTTVKQDIGASPADLVYGEGLAVPGEALPKTLPTDEQLARQREAALADLRVEVARLQPTETSAHRRPLIHLPDELHNCTHIFVRRGGVSSSLAAPYTGPYRVTSRNNQNFRVAIPGRPTETVAIARVKPAFVSLEDDADPHPPSPPPVGRPPRRPSGGNAPMGQQAPRRTRHRRVSTPPASAAASPQRQRHQSEDNNVFVNITPPRPRQPPPEPPPEPRQPSPERPQPQQQQPPAVEGPRRRLFSNPSSKNFSYNRQADGRRLPAAAASSFRQEASNQSHTLGKTRFFSTSAASRFSRPRLNLPTVQDAIRRHLQGASSGDAPGRPPSS